MRLRMGWRGSCFTVKCLLISVLILSGRLSHSCTVRNSPPYGLGECGATLANKIKTSQTFLIALSELLASLVPFGRNTFRRAAGFLGR